MLTFKYFTEILYFFWLLIYKYFECRSTRVKFIVKTQTILIGPILLVNKRHATWENQQQLDLTEWPSHRHWIKLSWGSIYVSTRKFLISQCALARASQICLVLTLIIAQSFQYQKRILLILFRLNFYGCNKIKSIELPATHLKIWFLWRNFF